MSTSKSQAWIRLPLAILSDERLTKADTVVLALVIDIINDKPQAEISRLKLAELSKYNEKTVRRAIQHLVECNYIAVERTGRANVYKLTKAVLQPKQRKNNNSDKKNEKHSKGEEIAKKYEIFTKM